MDDDILLVKEVLDGKIESFDLLVIKYQNKVYRYIYSMLNDKETCCDICQEVFITVYNKLYTYNSNNKFSNWVFKIARNKTIDHVRRNKKIQQYSIEDAQCMESNDGSPEQRIQFNETKRVVYEFLKTLKTKDREIITLKYSNEFISFYDIAQILNITESSAKKRFYRVRDKFRNYVLVDDGRCSK